MAAAPQFEAAPVVLVAEDQPDVQEALRLLLRGAGFSVDTAETPAAALTLLGQRHYDAILMDMNYRRDTTSGVEGLELLAQVRSRASAPPVIAMTAWGSVSVAVEAMQRGACDFIQKPWDNKQLLLVLEKHVQRFRDEQQRSRRHQLEMEEATSVQRKLMPSELPRIPGLEIEGVYRPAGAVAGDYFDVFQMGSKLALCIADVSGKGMAAALTMANIQAAVKVTAADWVTPADMCSRLNELACKNGAPGRFITLFYSIADPAAGRLRYCNAGHNPPVLVRADGSHELLQAGGAALGHFAGWNYQESEAALLPGDRLLLFSDGIIDAGYSGTGEFGEDRLLECLIRQRHGSAAEIRDALLAEVSGHCSDHFEDDATCLVVAVHSAGG